MRGARHPAGSPGIGMLAVALLAILAGGCGSSRAESSGEGSTKTATPPGAVVTACVPTPTGVGTLRVNGVDCAEGREIASSWIGKSACQAAPGASRTSCTVGAYRCLGIATERGLAVSCARPDRSISFVAKHS